MASWTNYWRIVTPQSRKTSYSQPSTINLDDGMNLNTAGYASFSTIAWFSNLLKGSTARLQRYKQYDAMDLSDISRALDVIAEEISNPDKRTGLPFIIDYQTEENQEIPDTTVTTIRAALRHWSKLHNLNKRVYNTARNLVKYGDCFFRKTSDTKKWEYVDATRVIGIEIDTEGEKVAYHIRPSSFKNSVSRNNQGNADSVEISPASAIIHFTLSDDMGDTAPFGLSILQSAFKDYQKLVMLEDSAIIYRIVRAPERRVFYIDVGNMPPQRVKQYIEQIRNDIRQKRSPNTANQNQTDSSYNPECLALDTKIPLLDGRTLELQDIIKEHQEGRINWAYSVNHTSGETVPGIITWAGVTRKNAKRIKLTLDNGKEIIVTPDHKFPIQGKGFVEAQDISTNDSLFPFVRKTKVMYGKSDYEQVWDSKSKKFEFTHRIVNAFMEDKAAHTVFKYKFKSDINKSVIHHLDFNRFNNTPSNLVMMDAEDHNLFHRETKTEWWNNLSDDRRAQVCANIAAGTKMAFDKMDPVVRQQQIDKATDRIRAYHYANKIQPSEKYSDWLASSASRIAALSNLSYIKELRKQNGKKNPNVLENQSLKISQEAISRMVEIIKANDSDRLSTMSLLEQDDVFMSIFREDNQKISGRLSKIDGTKVTDKYLRKACSFVGARNWKHFKEVALHYNHKIIAITEVENADVGTITIDGNETFHNYHTFALDAGVFTKNSIQEDYFFPTTAAGRGSRVETLPGGATWEIPELDYFLNKVFRALRVPTSYMKGPDGQGAQYNDGKVGIAYIEELRFANYIQRLQTCIEEVLDEQFKIYLQVTGINIDPDMFKLKLPEPQNFALYRQAALDADLIASFNAVEGVKYLSRRFILKRYLGLTEDDIQMNEALIKQERNIEDQKAVDELQQLYDPAVYDNRQAVGVEAPEPDASADSLDSTGDETAAVEPSPPDTSTDASTPTPAP